MPDDTADLGPQTPPDTSADAGSVTHVKRKLSPKTKKKLAAKVKPEREASTIAFPYADLEAAIGVAKAVLGAGGVPLSRDQLAGVMNLVVNSGNFVAKVATARTFGLLNYVGNKYELTDLGFAIADEKTQKAARATAFLTVPLYRRTYDEFRGKPLPPRPHGLEQAFVRFGVANKQKTNARLAFDKSATQAGFFPSGPDRLIEPIVGPGQSFERQKAPEDEPEAPKRRASYGDDEPAASNLHPFIQGLLDTLPAPGTNWAIEGRGKWLQAAANIFDLIYKGAGEITILSKAEPEPKPTQADDK